MIHDLLGFWCKVGSIYENISLIYENISLFLWFQCTARQFNWKNKLCARKSSQRTALKQFLWFSNTQTSSHDGTNCKLYKLHKLHYVKFQVYMADQWATSSHKIAGWCAREWFDSQMRWPSIVNIKWKRHSVNVHRADVHVQNATFPSASGQSAGVIFHQRTQRQSVACSLE